MTPKRRYEHFRGLLHLLREFAPVEVLATEGSGWRCLIYWPGGPRPIMLAPPEEDRRPA